MRKPGSAVSDDRVQHTLEAAASGPGGAQGRRRSPRTGARLLGLVLVMALVAAACGDDDDDDTQASDASSEEATEDNGGATDEGVTAEEVKIGLLTTKTGSAATASADFDRGFEAYVERVNDEGGVHGRTISVVGPRDDGGDANRNAAEMQTMFEQDKVFTVVGSFPQFGAINYVNDNKLPIIGTNYDPPTWETTEHAISISGRTFDATPGDDPDPEPIAAQAYVAKKLGITKIGVFGYNHPGSRAGAEQDCKDAAKFGLECVYTETSLPFGFTDLGASIDKIKASGAKAFFATMDAAGSLGILRSFKRAGLDDAIVFTRVPPSDDAAAAASDLIDNLFSQASLPPFDSDEPAVKAMVREIQARKPGTTMSIAVVNGWVAANLLHVGLEEAGPNLTREAFHEAITSIDNFDADGLVNAVDFTQTAEEKIRAGVEPDRSLCSGFLMRGDSKTGKLVQVGQKPKLCLNGVDTEAELDEVLEEDDSSLEVSEQ